MGKIRALFKKIWEHLMQSKGTFQNKGIFHAQMGSIKDRNGMDLTEAEDIRRGGKKT